MEEGVDAVDVVVLCVRRVGFFFFLKEGRGWVYGGRNGC